MKNKSYQPLSVLVKEGRHFILWTISKTMFVRGTVLLSGAISFVITCGYVKTAEGSRISSSGGVLSMEGERFAEEYDLAVAYLEGGSAYYVADHVRAKKKAAFIHIDYTKAGLY